LLELEILIIDQAELSSFKEIGDLMPKLVTLNASFNEITDLIQLHAFGNLPELSEINLLKNPVSELKEYSSFIL
jgi:Leucine-rich repeat (LRR) protein